MTNATTSTDQPSAYSRTAMRLMDAAQELIQHRGYNAFSYHDLADIVGIKTASIHYHFKTKADLGEALVRRYTDRLETSLAELDRRKRSARGRLKGFIDMYRKTGERDALCLCGSMAADAETLSEGTRQAVADYLGRCESWLDKAIRAGITGGEFGRAADATQIAQLMVASLQGALLIHRARPGKGSQVDHAEKAIFALLDGGRA